MSTFAEFQKTEYEHVAEAHFKANEAISLFFRYYLLVMSLPLPVFGVLFGLIGQNEKFEKAALSLLGVAPHGTRRIDLLMILASGRFFSSLRAKRSNPDLRAIVSDCSVGLSASAQ